MKILVLIFLVFTLIAEAQKPDVAEILSFKSEFYRDVKLTIALPSLRTDLDTELVNLSGLDIYREGELVETVGLESSQAGSTITVIDTPGEEGFYHYQVRVKAEEQDSELSNEVLAYASESPYEGQINVDNNFNNELSNAYLVGNWHTSDYFPMDGKSLTIADDGSYKANQSDTIIFTFGTPITGVDWFLRFSFYHTFAVNNEDVGEILISTDDMNSWVKFDDFKISDQDSWSDKELVEEDWYYQKYTSSEFPHGNETGLHFVAFVFNSNAFSEAEGWYIDELKLGYSLLFSAQNDEKYKSHLDVFPNPSHDVIYISNVGENLNLVEISISSLSGISVEAGIIVRENDIRVDVSKLKAGVYIIKAGMKSQKFIKL